MKEKYGNDLRIVFKHNPLPFHNRAMPAAMATECAREQGKFWQMTDKTFENNQAIEDANLESYAQAVGLDMKKWKDCYASNKHKARIEADQQVSAKFGARGTPAFFINGRFLSGAQPQPAFEALIDEVLKKAKESGVSKKDYYAKAVEGDGAKSL